MRAFTVALLASFFSVQAAHALTPRQAESMFTAIQAGGCIIFEDDDLADPLRPHDEETVLFTVLPLLGLDFLYSADYDGNLSLPSHLCDQDASQLADLYTTYILDTYPRLFAQFGDQGCVLRPYRDVVPQLAWPLAVSGLAEIIYDTEYDGYSPSAIILSAEICGTAAADQPVDIRDAVASAGKVGELLIGAIRMNNCTIHDGGSPISESAKAIVDRLSLDSGLPVSDTINSLNLLIEIPNGVVPTASSGIRLNRSLCHADPDNDGAFFTDIALGAMLMPALMHAIGESFVGFRGAHDMPDRQIPDLLSGVFGDRGQYLLQLFAREGRCSIDVNDRAAVIGQLSHFAHEHLVSHRILWRPFEGVMQRELALFLGAALSAPDPEVFEDAGDRWVLRNC